MRIEPLEIQFAGDEKDNSAHRREADVTSRLAFGCLEQPIEGFEEPVGLSGLSPRDNPVKRIPARSFCWSCHLLWGLNNRYRLRARSCFVVSPFSYTTGV